MLLFNVITLSNKIVQMLHKRKISIPQKERESELLQFQQNMLQFINLFHDQLQFTLNYLQFFHFEMFEIGKYCISIGRNIS